MNMGAWSTLKSVFGTRRRAEAPEERCRQCRVAHARPRYSVSPAAASRRADAASSVNSKVTAFAPMAFMH